MRSKRLDAGLRFGGHVEIKTDLLVFAMDGVIGLDLNGAGRIASGGEVIGEVDGDDEDREREQDAAGAGH